MVVDPLSLTVLGGVALTEGIKFLYGQTTELLKRRRDQAQVADSGTPPSPTDLVAHQPEVLDRKLQRSEVDFTVVASHERELRDLRSWLTDYVDGLADVDPNDRQLLERVSALRALLELAYGQHLTFRGEDRPASGTPLAPEAASQANTYAAQVTASGAGAVAVGRDVSGSVTTTTHNAPPASR